MGYGSGFTVEGLGLTLRGKVKGQAFRIQDLQFRAYGLRVEFRVQG
jgi:hypothetical protein